MPHEVRKNYLYSWCVDPLDGTKVRCCVSLCRRASLSRRSLSSATASSPST